MCELNSLWISYAFISDTETSWTEEIYMKDIVQALRSKDRILQHRCRLPDSNRHSIAEAKVSSHTDKSGVTIYLEYSPTKNGGSKNGAEPGVLTIHWNSELEAYKVDPDVVKFTPDKTDITELPLWRFLPHRDNFVKYFTFIDYKGTRRKMSEPFHAENFERYKKMFDEATFESLLAYVSMRVEKAGAISDFTVGWLFPNPWPPEIEPVIYDTLLREIKDHKEAYEQSAYMLSGLVQTAILESNHKWETFKTPYGNRALMFHRV